MGPGKVDRRKAPLPPKLPAPDNSLFPSALQPCEADMKMAPLKKAFGLGAAQRARSWHDQNSTQALVKTRLSPLAPLPSSPSLRKGIDGMPDEEGNVVLEA